MPHDTDPGDPAEILRAIERDQQDMRRALGPDIRLVSSLWGAAWIVGFLAFWLAFLPTGAVLSRPAASVTAGVALALAIVISAVHSARRGAGASGPSVVQGALYGNAYGIAFVFTALLGWRLTASGMPTEAALAYWVATPALIVGVMSVVGAAMFNDRFQLVFGGWVLVVGLVSLACPPPYNLLAGVAGGVGFLAFGAIAAIRPALVSGQITRGDDG